MRKILKWAGLGLLATVVVAVAAAYVTSDDACGETTIGEGARVTVILQCDYGPPPEVLRVASVVKPAPDDDQVLIRVRAAGVNPAEWHLVRGTPYLVRAIMGLRKPGTARIGGDYAGTVEAVGKNVTQFKPGDAVFGGRGGAYGEYIVARESGGIVAKPANVSFAQAGGVAIAGLTALQALRDKGELRQGQKVLINGASGGVGTFAVQIAKAMGAEVTGVASTRNLDLLRSLGADHVIDYTVENFTLGGRRYDLILDNVGNHALLDLRRALKPGGAVVMIGGGGPDDDPWIGPLWQPIKGVVLSLFVEERFIFFVSAMSRSDLSQLAELMAAGKLAPVVERTYPLAEAAAALTHVETGRARGKVVLTME